MPNNSLASLFRNFANNISTAGDSTLVEIANLAAENIKNNAPTENIKKNIKISSVERDGNSSSIVISIGTGEGEAPEAPAFEFGSGERGPKGEKYLIDPKNPGGRLFFPWDAASPPDPDLGESKGKFAGMVGNKFLMHYVEHPGIEKRPFFFEAVRDAVIELHGRYNEKISIAWANAK